MQQRAGVRRDGPVRIAVVVAVLIAGCGRDVPPPVPSWPPANGREAAEWLSAQADGRVDPLQQGPVVVNATIFKQLEDGSELPDYSLEYLSSGGRVRLTRTFSWRRVDDVGFEREVFVVGEPGVAYYVTYKSSGEQDFPWTPRKEEDVADLRSRLEAAASPLRELWSLPRTGQLSDTVPAGVPVCEALRRERWLEVVSAKVREDADGQQRVRLQFAGRLRSQVWEDMDAVGRSARPGHSTPRRGPAAEGDPSTRLDLDLVGPPWMVAGMRYETRRGTPEVYTMGVEASADGGRPVPESATINLTVGKTPRPTRRTEFSKFAWAEPPASAFRPEADGLNLEPVRGRRWWASPVFASACGAAVVIACVGAGVWASRNRRRQRVVRPEG